MSKGRRDKKKEGTALQRKLYFSLSKPRIEFREWHREMKRRGVTEDKITKQLKKEVRNYV